MLIGLKAESDGRSRACLILGTKFTHLLQTERLKFMLFLCLASLVAVFSQGEAASSDAFRGKWRGESTECDAAREEQSSPHHCRTAIVGAAWSGVYFAWRLAVDAGVVNASEVCVFEAGSRVGGRVDSVRGLPSLDDLAIDLGGYRFIETDLLPAQLVWNALELPTNCYDYHCHPPASEGNGCEGGANCYVIRDSYGNNAGYATPIETMLGQLEDKGGVELRQTYFGYTLQNVSMSTSQVKNQNMQLRFRASSNEVVVENIETLLLALPHNALMKIEIEPAFTHPVSSVLDTVVTTAMNKVYAYYADAWWCSKLGLMEGNFVSNTNYTNASVAPLAGRYHDGPLKCQVGIDDDGQPIYSGSKVKYGNCSGALEVFYSIANDFYVSYNSDPLAPITVVTDDNSTLKLAVHRALLAYHADQLLEAGIALDTIALPETIILSNWFADAPYTPGIGHFNLGNRARALARAPTNGTANLFIANQDYGYKTGWAVGGLRMAEKILQAELNVSKPTWLDSDYYQTNVVDLP